MRVAGLEPRSVLRLVREARDGAPPPGAILVSGPLAPQLARLLTADGGDPALVRAGGDVAGASALVCVLAGAASPEQVQQLRGAARAGISTVAVQMGAAAVAVPYVLPGDVIACPPGEGFPVEAIAASLCRSLGRGAAPLAARLPVLREAALRALATRGAAVAAGLAAAPWGAATHLPLLVPLQARMLRDLTTASGAPAPVTQQELGVAVGPELGAALGAGLLARSFVRRLPRSRVFDAAVAGAVTLALATAAQRLR